MGCIWNHFGVTRALKYVPGTCDVIIVALISSGHIWTNHAWINPMFWFISVLILFSFCSIVIQYKKGLTIYSNYIWVPSNGLCAFDLLGTLWSSQRFSWHISFWRRYIFKVDFQVMLYLYDMRHGIDNHLRLSFIPNLIFHDPCSTVPRRSVGHFSSVTSRVESEIAISDCSPFEWVKFKWKSN